MSSPRSPSPPPSPRLGLGTIELTCFTSPDAQRGDGRPFSHLFRSRKRGGSFCSLFFVVLPPCSLLLLLVRPATPNTTPTSSSTTSLTGRKSIVWPFPLGPVQAGRVEEQKEEQEQEEEEGRQGR